MSLILASFVILLPNMWSVLPNNYRTKVALDAKELIAAWAIMDITWAQTPDLGLTWFRRLKFFFSTVSCSLGITIQDSGGCKVTSLEHFQIFTFFQNGRRRNWGKSNF